MCVRFANPFLECHGDASFPKNTDSLFSKMQTDTSKTFVLLKVVGVIFLQIILYCSRLKVGIGNLSQASLTTHDVTTGAYFPRISIYTF